MSNQDFEHSIKEKFKTAYSNVPSGTWEGISSQLSSSATSSGLFTSILGKVAGLAVLISAVVVILLTLSSDYSKETVQKAEAIYEEVSAPLEESALSEPANTEEYKTEISEVKKEKTNRKKRRDLPPTILIPESPEKVGEDLQDIILSELERPVSVDSKKSYNNPNHQETLSSDKDHDANTVVLAAVRAKKISSIRLDAKKNVFSYELDQSSSSQRITWYINDVLISEESSFDYEFTAAGEFTIMALVLNESGGLVNTLFHREKVVLEPVLLIPNTFTPQSSSGYNDVFDIDIEKSENILWYEISIFNAKGSLVFQSNNDIKGWNGLDINENLAPEGPYIYVVNYKSESGKAYSERGKVVLQR